MNNTTYGYIRVSSKDQNEDRQRIAMREAGVEERYIFMDKQSGKDFDRPGYRRVLRKLKPDDTLIIKSIDRLGRNYEEILEQWRIITKEKRAAIVVLDMPLLDTRQGRDLTGTLIADIVLQLLSYVAQTEREFIRQRQAEGIAAAKANGVRFGRRPMERPVGFDAVCAEWMSGKLSARAAAKRLGISRQTFLNWTKETVKNSYTLTASLCIAIFVIFCYHFCEKLVNVALHTKVSCDVKQSVIWQPFFAAGHCKKNEEEDHEQANQTISVPAAGDRDAAGIRAAGIRREPGGAGGGGRAA